jgi:hypothetical protein
MMSFDDGNPRAAEASAPKARNVENARAQSQRRKGVRVIRQSSHRCVFAHAYSLTA